MNDDFTTEDIAQMRRDGDYRAFMRTRQRPTQKPDTIPASRPPTEVGPDGHIPGAWPIGAVGVASDALLLQGVVCSCRRCQQLSVRPAQDGASA